MRVLMLLIGLVLLVCAIVIIFTDTKIETLGLALGMCVIAGYLFRLATDEDF